MPYPTPSGSRPVTPVPPADQYPSVTPPVVQHVEPVQTHLPPRPQQTQQRRKHKTPLGWLPWALLGLLGLLLLLSLLAGKLAGGDDTDTADTARTGDRGTAAAPADNGGGTLTVGSTDLLASSANLGKLGALGGQQAVGRNVNVQSVVADEGFWVGSSAADRVFVYLTPEARKSNGESGFQVKAGQSIDLNGTVAKLKDAGSLGVTDSEGAAQLQKQGSYITATSVRLSS